MAEESPDRSRARVGRSQLDAERVGRPWGCWWRLSSSLSRSRETSSCSSRMAWLELGVETGMKNGAQ